MSTQVSISRLRPRRKSQASLPQWGDESVAGKTGVIPIRARCALSRSRVPGMKFTINPYGGCGFGCTYCYATFVGRRLGHEPATWGRYVYVKQNLPEVLDDKLGRLRKRDGPVFLSSVTDPYQPVERRHRLCRQALELLVRHRYMGRVMVMSKSSLITRDIDLLSQLDSRVGLSLSSWRDPVSRALEAHAPGVDERLAALVKLNEAKLSTYVFLGPVFPHLVETPDVLDELMSAIRQTGTRQVYLAHFNLRKDIRERVARQLDAVEPQLSTRYYHAAVRGLKGRLATLLPAMARRHRLELLYPRVIDHY